MKKLIHLLTALSIASQSFVPHGHVKAATIEDIQTHRQEEPWFYFNQNRRETQFHEYRLPEQEGLFFALTGMNKEDSFQALKTHLETTNESPTKKFLKRLFLYDRHHSPSNEEILQYIDEYKNQAVFDFFDHFDDDGDEINGTMEEKYCILDAFVLLQRMNLYLFNNHGFLRKKHAFAGDQTSHENIFLLEKHNGEYGFLFKGAQPNGQTIDRIHAAWQYHEDRQRAQQDAAEEDVDLNQDNNLHHSVEDLYNVFHAPEDAEPENQDVPMAEPMEEDAGHIPPASPVHDHEAEENEVQEQQPLQTIHVARFIDGRRNYLVHGDRRLVGQEALAQAYGYIQALRQENRHSLKNRFEADLLKVRLYLEHHYIPMENNALPPEEEYRTALRNMLWTYIRGNHHTITLKRYTNYAKLFLGRLHMREQNHERAYEYFKSIGKQYTQVWKIDVAEMIILSDFVPHDHPHDARAYAERLLREGKTITPWTGRAEKDLDHLGAVAMPHYQNRHTSQHRKKALLGTLHNERGGHHNPQAPIVLEHGLDPNHNPFNPRRPSRNTGESKRKQESKDVKKFPKKETQAGVVKTKTKTLVKRQRPITENENKGTKRQKKTKTTMVHSPLEKDPKNESHGQDREQSPPSLSPVEDNQKRKNEDKDDLFDFEKDTDSLRSRYLSAISIMDEHGSIQGMEEEIRQLRQMTSSFSDKKICLDFFLHLHMIEKKPQDFESALGFAQSNADVVRAHLFVGLRVERSKREGYLKKVYDLMQDDTPLKLRARVTFMVGRISWKDNRKKYLHEVLSLPEHPSIKEIKAETHIELGKIAGQKIRIPHFHRALELLEDSQNNKLKAMAHMGLGNDLKNEKSITHFHHALEIFENMKNNYFMAKAHIGLGNFLTGRKSIDHYHRALELATDNEYIVKAEAHVGLGNVLRGEESASHFRKALELLENNNCRYYNVKARALIGLGVELKNDEGIQCFKRALDLADLNPIRARALESLGNARHIYSEKYPMSELWFLEAAMISHGNQQKKCLEKFERFFQESIEKNKDSLHQFHRFIYSDERHIYSWLCKNASKKFQYLLDYGNFM